MITAAEKKTTAPSFADKRDLLLGYERLQAARFARLVLEKPRPPVWIICTPISFVFFAMKLKDYKVGLENFAKDWMVTRELAIDVAYDAAEGNCKPKLERLLREAWDMEPEVVPYYRDWVEALVNHFCRLLEAEGGNAEAIIRSRYRNRTNFQLVLRQIARFEYAYLQALLPTLPGDQDDLQATVERIRLSDDALQLRQVTAVFT